MNLIKDEGLLSSYRGKIDEVLDDSGSISLTWFRSRPKRWLVIPIECPLAQVEYQPVLNYAEREEISELIMLDGGQNPDRRYGATINLKEDDLEWDLASFHTVRQWCFPKDLNFIFNIENPDIAFLFGPEALVMEVASGDLEKQITGFLNDALFGLPSESREESERKVRVFIKRYNG